MVSSMLVKNVMMEIIAIMIPVAIYVRPVLPTQVLWE
jgi:hypothetical protein